MNISERFLLLSPESHLFYKKRLYYYNLFNIPLDALFLSNIINKLKNKDRLCGIDTYYGNNRLIISDDIIDYCIIHDYGYYISISDLNNDLDTEIFTAYVDSGTLCIRIYNKSSFINISDMQIDAYLFTQSLIFNPDVSHSIDINLLNNYYKEVS